MWLLPDVPYTERCVRLREIRIQTDGGEKFLFHLPGEFRTSEKSGLLRLPTQRLGKLKVRHRVLWSEPYRCARHVQRPVESPSRGLVRTGP